MSIKTDFEGKVISDQFIPSKIISSDRRLLIIPGALEKVFLVSGLKGCHQACQIGHMHKLSVNNVMAL